MVFVIALYLSLPGWQVSCGLDDKGLGMSQQAIYKNDGVTSMKKLQSVGDPCKTFDDCQMYCKRGVPACCNGLCDCSCDYNCHCSPNY
ncbi:hypothetical protein Hanom_Chr16g01441781 [Helianthus anomalus]